MGFCGGFDGVFMLFWGFFLCDFGGGGGGGVLVLFGFYIVGFFPPNTNLPGMEVRFTGG